MDKNQIFSTKHWKVILLPEDQTYLGRCVVVCQKPVPSLSELTDQQWLDFAQVIQALESAMTKAFDATMFNWACLMNLAYQNNPPDPHVHWHVRPRYDHPVQFGGETFEDKAFGNHYERGTSREVSDEMAGKIIEAIKQALPK